MGINLKSLIRFEDTYGLADIFCARRKIPYINIKRKEERMIQITSDLFMDFGLGQGWGSMSNDEAYSIMERGIERIILVYDMDNLEGDKTKLITQECLKSRIDNINSKFKDIGYSAEICLIPIVYAAETIMLYQFLRENEDDEEKIFYLVSPTNTNMLHLCLLAYMIGANNYKEAKKVRNFIDINELVNGFKDMAEYDPNDMVKQWIIDGCDAEDQNIFNREQALQALEETYRNFVIRKRLNRDTVITIDEIVRTIDDIKEIFVNK